MTVSIFGALVIARPDEARRTILAAVERAKGDRTVAAKALGLTQVTLYRYVRKLRLFDEIDAMVARHGWVVITPPNRGVDRVRIEMAEVRRKRGVPASERATVPPMLARRIVALSRSDDVEVAYAAHKLRVRDAKLTARELAALTGLDVDHVRYLGRKGEIAMQRGAVTRDEAARWLAERWATQNE